MDRPFDDALDGACGLARGGLSGLATVVGGLGGHGGVIQALGQGDGLVFGLVQLGFQPVDAPCLYARQEGGDGQGGEKGADHRTNSKCGPSVKAFFPAFRRAAP